MRLLKMKVRIGYTAGRLLLCAVWLHALETAAVSRFAFHPGRILVQAKPGVTAAALGQLHAAARAEVLRGREQPAELQVVAVPDGETVASLVARYRASGLVQFAEPDYLRTCAAEPNDPKYMDGTEWALHNFGQSGGKPGADISAAAAWDLLTSAEHVVVAIIDTGVRGTHEDLAANMWVSPNDASHGLNALTGSNTTDDDEGHGTLVAGVIGAAGNNGKGMAGVAWKTKLMACKAFDSARNGYDSAIIACIDFARTNSARIINASWGGYAFGEALSNAVFRARNDGILIVAAAGNDGKDIDSQPYYPAALRVDNVISLAFTTRADELGGISNYGATNVALAAPGDQIYSTFFTSDKMYLGPLSGTSFAAPYVCGALALMSERFPAYSPQQLIRQLLDGADRLPALAGKCFTGARLNLLKALSPPLRLESLVAGDTLQVRVFSNPNRECTIERSTNLLQWAPVFTGSTSAAGELEFEDPLPQGNGPRFYRSTAAP
jgi:subtilisin family serine protease